MAAYWGTSLAKSFSFFTSYTPKVTFDPKKSLYCNFVDMCSTGIFQPNSNQTNQLIDALKQHDQSKTHKIIQHPSLEMEEEYLQSKVASLNTILVSLENWKKSRSAASSRSGQVELFRNNIEIYLGSIKIRLLEIKSQNEIKTHSDNFFKQVEDQIQKNSGNSSPRSNSPGSRNSS